MLHMQQHQGGVERRLLVIGIPIYTIKPLIREMVKWEHCSGVEWTIKRLKGLKVDLIRRKSGLPPLTWVRKNRRGDVHGILGSLFRWSDKSDRNFNKVLQAFMAYTFYILPSLTESQKVKFLSGINPEDPDDHLPDEVLTSFGKSVARAIKRHRVRMAPDPMVTYQGSPDKKAPSFFGRKSVHQNSNILDDLHLFNTEGGIKLYSHYQRLYSPLLVGVKQRRDWLDWVAGNSRSRPAPDYPIRGGEIHFLQEPGGKLRSVASPFRIHQLALRPLGRLLYDVVRTLPWDCTFDQSKAIPHIQSHLERGGQIHSIDLSSATDHFPLRIQECALRSFIHRDDWDHIDLFVEISRGMWSSPIGDLQWTKGQPLGLFPSFAAFTLTHGLLLHYLNHGFNHDFFVVGDDVVILSQKLYDDYMSMLDWMGCPYSSDKSLSSETLCEFAGKVITKTQVIPQLKWRRMSNDNFLDICRLLGIRSRALLSSRQKVVFDRVAHLCDPIGLNFSMKGDNLSKMIERTMDFYQPEKLVLGSLMGLRKKINTIVYTSSESLDSDELETISATFDEKVKSVLVQTLFSRWETCLSIGLEGLETIPSALGLVPRLPTKEFTPSWCSTLDRYERILSQVRP